MWPGLLGALLVAAVGCEGSNVGTSKRALAGTSFESTDGNLVVDLVGGEDWINAPARVAKIDIADPKTDNAFGQGAKEDLSNPSVVQGSIPPNKSDLTRFYVAHENAGGDFMLYLAWERTNILGSANMDFEFNQSSTLTSNGVTPARTAGDLLVTFDFVKGGGTPVLGLLRWVTSGATSQCFANNSLPCWGNRVDLSAAGFADGSVNLVSVTDPVPPNAPRTLSELTFGEAAINLSDAGVFPAGQCVNFASAYLKSRSSASFTAELKDFIAPANADISNCAQVRIHKQDDLGAPLAGAVFTLFSDLAPAYPTATSHGAEDPATLFTCTTNASGDCSITDVPFGDYWAVETVGVPDHFLAADQPVHLDQSTPSGVVSLTFVDVRQPGALVVTKLAANKSLGSGLFPLAGATFQLSQGGVDLGAPAVSGADGTVCFEGLTLGLPYTVTETAAPTGYSVDTASKSTIVTAYSTCAAAANAATLSFVDTPLSRITVSFQSLVAPGVTTATIQCTGDAADSPLPEGSPRVLDLLPPGTYTCTVVVDP